MNKKLLALTIYFIFPLFHRSVSFSQSIDTASWSITSNQTDGKYTLLKNRVTYYGISSGNVIMPIVFNTTTIDTSKWQFITSQIDGSYRQIQNKVTIYGITSGNLKANLIYDANAPNLSGYAYKDSTTSFTVQQKLLTGTASVDALHGSSASVTLNKQTGKITVTNPSAGAGNTFTLTVNNSLVITGSVIIPVIETTYDFAGATETIVPHITNVSNGSFTYSIAAVAGDFAADFKLHFIIFNP